MFNNGYSVLLVDDESTSRKLLENWIGQMPGIQVAASLPNGLSARKYLLEHVVDIVITDIMMPLMDGLELAEFIHLFAPCCPVIIISGYGEFSYAQKALQYGVKDYLLKPIRHKRILEVLEKSCEEVRRNRESQLFQRFSTDQDLESQLFKAFVNGRKEQEWLQALNAQISESAAVVRIEEGEEKYQREEMSLVYKNILGDALPGWKIFRLRYDKGRYDFLVSKGTLEYHRNLKSIPEYLNRILVRPIKWTEVCTINAKEELCSLAVILAPEEKNHVVEVASKYMEEHIGEALTRDLVATQVYLSPSYFGHLFKNEKGMSFSEYLTEIRIRKAKKLFGENMTVHDVAAAVGFCDTKYFSELFSKKTGYTPSEYKRALLKGEAVREE